MTRCFHLVSDWRIAKAAWLPLAAAALLGGTPTHAWAQG
jgi:hypothetical protein